MTAYDEENFVSNSSITLETPEVQKLRPRISLIGVGGGGGNALKTMVEQGLDGVELFAVNTDVQDLENLSGVTSIPIGLLLPGICKAQICNITRPKIKNGSK